jgi:hypothetical protein
LAKQLEIITHYALPYNAKAKPIERFFRTFEEQLGKLWQSYCGNNPNNRPRRLKNLNRDQYHTFEEWKEIHDMYIDKNYNMAPHVGNGMDSKSPYEVYYENLDANLVFKDKDGHSNKAYVLSHAVKFIKQNYMDKITLKDIADFYHCSESYMSHSLKKHESKYLSLPE